MSQKTHQYYTKADRGVEIYNKNLQEEDMKHSKLMDLLSLQEDQSPAWLKPSEFLDPEFCPQTYVNTLKRYVRCYFYILAVPFFCSDNMKISVILI